MNATPSTSLHARRDMSPSGRGRRVMVMMLPALLVAYVAVPLAAVRR